MSLPAPNKRTHSAQQRKYAVEQVLKEKRSVSEIACELSVARKTIYFWVKRYKKTSPRDKAKAFQLKYPKGADHPRSYRHKIKALLVKEVAKDPDLSATDLSRKIKAGRHAVVNLLRELKLSTREDREALARLYKAPGRLHLDVKEEIVRKIIEEGRSFASVSREFNVSRKTLYEWVGRFKEEGKVREKYLFGFEHPRAYQERQEKAILDRVARAPELSIHKLAKNLGFSSHGIYSVLKRHRLTYRDARIAYATARRAERRITFVSQVTDRVRLVWEQ